MKELAEKIVAALIDQIEQDQAVIKDKAVERVMGVLGREAASAMAESARPMFVVRPGKSLLEFEVDPVREYKFRPIISDALADAAIAQGIVTEDDIIRSEPIPL